MREIRFRVWDKKRCSFHWGLGNVCMSLGGHLMWQFGFKAPDILSKEECENYDVQQYIGIKDKNGKEIYEGDIVTWYINGMKPTAVINFEHGSFWMCHDISKEHNMGSVCNDWLRGEYEVIGNIWQNPELLSK